MNIRVRVFNWICSELLLSIRRKLLWEILQFVDIDIYLPNFALHRFPQRSGIQDLRKHIVAQHSIFRVRSLDNTLPPRAYYEKVTFRSCRLPETRAKLSFT